MYPDDRVHKNPTRSPRAVTTALGVRVAVDLWLRLRMERGRKGGLLGNLYERNGANNASVKKLDAFGHSRDS